jgi:hypothetical protein
MSTPSRGEVEHDRTGVRDVQLRADLGAVVDALPEHVDHPHVNSLTIRRPFGGAA